MDKQILGQYIDACELVKDTEEEIRKLRKRRRQMQQDENRVNREHLKQVEEFIAKVGRLDLGGEP